MHEAAPQREVFCRVFASHRTPDLVADPNVLSGEHQPRHLVDRHLVCSTHPRVDDLNDLVSARLRRFQRSTNRVDKRGLPIPHRLELLTKRLAVRSPRQSGHDRLDSDARGAGIVRCAVATAALWIAADVGPPAGSVGTERLDHLDGAAFEASQQIHHDPVSYGRAVAVGGDDQWSEAVLLDKIHEVAGLHGRVIGIVDQVNPAAGTETATGTLESDHDDALGGIESQHIRDHGQDLAWVLDLGDSGLPVTQLRSGTFEGATLLRHGMTLVMDTPERQPPTNICGHAIGDDGPVRNVASILHLDLDAFFAAVEQRDKPSLRGKPVIVGGVGGRGVVATASYEARRFGVRSAMSTAEARSRCPHAAFLVGRFDAYRAASVIVMRQLHELSPLVEPLSLDEAYVDLAASPADLDLSPPGLEQVAATLKQDVREATGGLTASVGLGTSKLIAKIASELEKPSGTVIVAPGTELELLGPMQVTVIPGVGPATAARLRHVGVQTVEDLQRISAEELIRVVGQAHGNSLYALGRAQDDRAVIAERETKSISVEDTFDIDLVDPVLLAAIIDRHARSVCERLTKAKLSGRTVTVKVRLHDFTTMTRSATIVGPTDRPAVVSRLARGLLAELDTSAGVRLLGVGVSGLSDWIQDDLFVDEDDELDEPLVIPEGADLESRPRHGRGWMPGMDVEHREFGPGWVWGAGVGRVTVRFETAKTGPGPVRTLAADDPDLVRRPVIVEDDPLTPAEIATDLLDAPAHSEPGPPAG